MNNKEIRVGVFICDCGTNIAGFVDVPDLVEYSKSLDSVVFADEGKWSCSVDYLNKLKDIIKDNDINRVVIASCTPRTHESLFKSAVAEAGLNPYLLEFVSIREQVSWVHMEEKEAGTQKAKDLIKMGVAKARLLEEGEEIKLPVGNECMIIGGGISGMSAALSIAEQGFTAYLIEKKDKLGGLLNSISSISHGEHEKKAKEIVLSKIEELKSHSNIKIFTNTEIENVEGYIGNYTAHLKTGESLDTIKVSTVIVATGMEEVLPENEFNYSDDDRVITQLQLEKLLKEGALKKPERVVMINCANSKNEKRGCCSIGCRISVRNAIAIKTLYNEAQIYILYRDMSMIMEEYHILEKAKRLGVKFIRFSDDKYPEVISDEKELNIKVYDILLGKEFSLSSDLAVLTVGFKGNDTTDKVKGLLKVSANSENFFQESHVKLGPLEFPADGISLCGCAKRPMTFKESFEEGIGAAMRVSIPMKNGYIETEGIVADIDLTDCDRCGLCYKRCPYNAIQVNEDKEPEVIKALCKGCGLCAADCPKECINIVHYRDDQIFAQIEAALEDTPEKKIIGFVCHWCALGGVDMAGVSRLQYPTNARLIRVMCSARVSIKMIERAFELKAAGVLVAGCEFPTCHYITGNYAAEKRIKRAKRILSKKGYDAEKLWNVWCSAADGPKFANTMRDMIKDLGL
jgi:heterodisulfide reductase subunit A2